ncbi:hypothetical protein [Streptomyces sp. NPDC090994]|uniref:hypothetical protein n=1 Tax=Streptomyces sp. NPDC090994 TaxID=3365969 RepID=UPI00381E59D4
MGQGQGGERRRTPAYDEELGAAVARTQAGDEAAFAVAYRIVQHRLFGYVRALPRDQAEAVLLLVVVGLDGPAAGRVLGERPGAVRIAAYRGLGRLARQLGAEGVCGVGGPT